MAHVNNGYDDDSFVDGAGTNYGDGDWDSIEEEVKNASAGDLGFYRARAANKPAPGEGAK